MDLKEYDMELGHDPANDRKKRPQEAPNIGAVEETRGEKRPTLGLGSSAYGESNVISMTPYKKRRLIMNLTSPASSKELQHFAWEGRVVQQELYPFWLKNCYLSPPGHHHMKKTLRKKSHWLSCRATS